MLHLDGTLIFAMTVLLAIVASLVYDLLVNLRQVRPRAVSAPPGGAAVAPEPTVSRPIRVAPVTRAVSPVSSARVEARLPLGRRAAVAGPPSLPEPDPIAVLATRIRTLQQLGLNHVRAGHPIFRPPPPQPTWSVTVVSPTSMRQAGFGMTCPPEPRRSRPRASRRSPGLRMSGHLRLVEKIIQVN